MGDEIDQFMKDNADLLDSLSMQENYDKSIASLRAELSRAQTEVERIQEDNEHLEALVEGHKQSNDHRRAMDAERDAYHLRLQLEACRALNGKLRDALQDIYSLEPKSDDPAVIRKWDRETARKALAQSEEQAGREWAAMREALEDARQLLSALEQFDIRAGAKGGLVLGERKVLWEHSLTDRLRASLAKVDASREGKL